MIRPHSGQGRKWPRVAAAKAPLGFVTARLGYIQQTSDLGNIAYVKASGASTFGEFKLTRAQIKPKTSRQTSRLALRILPEDFPFDEPFPKDSPLSGRLFGCGGRGWL